MIGKAVSKFKDYKKANPQDFTQDSFTMLKTIGNNVIEIMFIKAAMNNRLSSDSIEFRQLREKIYHKIKELDKVSKEDTKEAVGYLEFQDDRDSLKNINKYIENEVFQQLLKEFEPFTLDDEDSESVSKPNWQPSAISNTLNNSSLISINTTSLNQSTLLSSTNTSKSSNVKFQVIESFNSQPLPNLEQYLSSLPNAKTQLNQFHQQLKLEIPEFKKIAYGGGWKGTCTIKTANKNFDVYKRDVYVGESINPNGKVAETEAALIALRSLYQENPDIWEKYKKIKMKLGLP